MSHVICAMDSGTQRRTLGERVRRHWYCQSSHCNLSAQVDFPRDLCSGVKYPKMYAEGESKEANTFNCIQRCHQNTSEQIGPVLVTQALLGLYHPIAAASLGATWAIGKPGYLCMYADYSLRNHEDETTQFEHCMKLLSC